MKIDNSYIELGDAFYQQISPVAVTAPTLMLWNQPLAEQLQIDNQLIATNEQRAAYFSGNRCFPGAQPIALAYAGHQFGQYNPQLGDGRAHLLCELIDKQGKRWDLQLKGSGPTRYSRRGDGRCALKPALREFLMSEAMYNLGIPTSRCLAVVSSGEHVYRQLPEPGAVVTRIAASHLRVGTFQYFAAKGELAELRTLTNYAITRHFPELTELPEQARVLAFFEQVISRQIQLITQWMRIGFIHGVMNTDNTAICGETIDFGPCAMLGIYHPGTVYSAIDVQGRYAFGNQPSICRWNMARLGEALLPLLDDNDALALKKVEAVLSGFSAKFTQAYFDMYGAKLGLPEPPFGSEEYNQQSELIQNLLSRMQQQQLDYTDTFYRLTLSLNNDQQQLWLQQQLGDWYTTWQERLPSDAGERQQAQQRMAKNNPVVIPRNHHVEEVLSLAERDGEAAAIESFLEVLRSPYQELPQTRYFQDLPEDGDRNYQTFCGT